MQEQREIKFRAVNKNNGRIEGHKEAMRLLYNAACGVCDLTTSVHAMQQFTGLKDKNGKEIYTGDYVKDLEDAVGEVYLDKGAFMVDYGRRGKYYLGDRDMKDIEIIGNIYKSTHTSL